MIKLESREFQIPNCECSPIVGPHNHVHMSLVNVETNEKINPMDIYEHFYNLTATGFYVKSNRACPQPYPYGGPVTDITEDDVFINGSPVPRKNFFDWYELD